ncbi:hypothetical protein N9W15_05875 [Porticoccaceae bacterium]|nr:hypothetical protein [Porticoccaceae bacterium]MDA7696551.1 hypothetical protein [Porticoccaceae bacterium]MDA7768504.1 hypothetical protein [Porticoccaceae bacterium]MDA9583038.1 hypothetical protein [Porticoccaceae bacterium]MDB2400921.1 hypothetical protein [Porticoccaceae bacterium]
MAGANTNKQFVDTDQFFVMRFEKSDVDIDPDLDALSSHSWLMIDIELRTLRRGF